MVRVDVWYQGNTHPQRNIVHALVEADGIRSVEPVAIAYAERVARTDKKLLKLVFRSAAAITFPQPLPFKLRE